MKNVIFYAIVIVLLGSCASSNNTVSNSFLLKRKYNKGFYVSPRNIKPTLSKYKQFEKTNISIKNEGTTIQKHKLPQKVEDVTLNSDKTTDNEILTDNKTTPISYAPPIKKITQIKNKVIQSTQTFNTRLNKNNKSSISSNDDEGDETDEDFKLILGVLLILMGLPPFGILVVKGKGPEFRKNLIFWILGEILIIIGLIIIIMGAYSTLLALIIIGSAIALLALIFLLFSFINALITIFKK